MIVNVLFKNRFTGEYCGQKYSYYTALNLEPGQLVKVPTASGDSVARVEEVNVPASCVSRYVRDNLKTISELAPEEAEANG